MNKRAKVKQRNSVAKHAHKFNRSVVQPSKKLKQKSRKTRNKPEELL